MEEKNGSRRGSSSRKKAGMSWGVLSMARTDNLSCLGIGLVLLVTCTITSAWDKSPDVPTPTITTYIAEATTFDTLVVDKPPEASTAPEDYNPAIPLSVGLQAVLREACEEYGVPIHLALGVMERESGFDPEAVGMDGKDIGLYQIRTSNHEWLTGATGADPMTPDGNIRCGVWLLGYLLGRYDTQEAALTAYRWGRDNGKRSYATAVLEEAEEWRSKLDIKKPLVTAGTVTRDGG